MNRRQLSLGMICFGLSGQPIATSAQWEPWSPPENELQRLSIFRSFWHDRDADVPVHHVWAEAQVYEHESLAREAYDFYVTPPDESVTRVVFCDVEVSVANIKEELDPDDVGADEVFVRQLLGGGYYFVLRKGNLTFVFGFLARPGADREPSESILRSVIHRGKVAFRYSKRNIEELVPSREDLEHVSSEFVLEYEDVYEVRK